MMRKCDETDVVAPRVGCACRECYRARESSLDPRLISLVRERRFDPVPQHSPARDFIYRCIEMYLMGRIEWASLYMEIITGLVQQNDDAYSNLLKLTSLQQSMFVLKDT